MGNDQRPWWDRNQMSVRGTFISSAIWIVIAAAILSLALTGVFRRSMWQVGVIWLIVGAIYLVWAVARLRRRNSQPVQGK